MNTVELWPCCGQPQRPAVPTCTVKTVEIPGDAADEILPAVAYSPDYGGADQRCHDCGISRNGFHHPGCDMERCPKCEGQLISCGCLSDDAWNAWQRVKEENERLREQLRIATDQLQAFSDQGQERYPGEMGTFARDALIQISVEAQSTSVDRA